MDISMTKNTKSNYFEIYYTEEDETFALTLSGRADKLYENLNHQFGFKNLFTKHKINLIVCESVTKFQEITGKTPEAYQEWMVGNCDFENRKIALLSPRVSTTHTTDELEKVFVHETIHMLFDTYAGNLNAPIWCAEGIATLYAEQVPLNYVNESDYPKVTELLDEETFADYAGYDYSGVYVWYFLKRYGFAKFLELYTNMPGTYELIYEGFEPDAIREIKKRTSYTI